MCVARHGSASRGLAAAAIAAACHLAATAAVPGVDGGRSDVGGASGDDACWDGDFNANLCCGEAWGLVGNPICWGGEYTYLRCCGLDALPRAPEADAAWDAELARAGKPEAAGEYDFIVVGAGAAGSVVAARLAAAIGADGRPFRVLLLEEGGEAKPEKVADPDKAPRDQAMWREALNASWGHGRSGLRTWGYSTGRGLGGTAAFNSMIYMRGSVSEYQALMGGDDWSAEAVLEAFRALEAPMEAPGFAAQEPFHRSLALGGGADTAGYHLSLVSATRDELPPVFRALVDSFEQAGVPFRVDPHGARTMHGVGGVWRAMGCGHERCQPARVPRFRMAKGRPRSSTYMTLVAPLRNRSDDFGARLDVVTQAQVVRVVMTAAGEVRGVEAMVGSTGPAERKLKMFGAVREVVISAGTFNSPKVLALSGVGEPAELRRLGVPVVTASPDLGRHLHEHIGVSLVVCTNVPCPEGYHMSEDAGRTTHLGNTDQFIAQFYVFLNATKDTLGADGPLDAEIMLLEGCLEDRLSLTFTVMMLQSRTRGRIVVQSRSPSQPPFLEYKPLGDSRDIDTLANVIRRLYAKVFSVPAMLPFDLSVTPEWKTVADMEKFVPWIRENLWYYSHPGGTCRARRGEDSGVVDSDLRVLGTSGLRVADASVFPDSPTAHTDGPSRLVGEMAARFILRDADRAAHGEECAGRADIVQLHGYRGVCMPLAGFGTNGLQGERAVAVLSRFIRQGGRLIDTAVLYENHRDVREAIARSSVPRKDIFVVTKLPPSDMGFKEAGAAIDRAIAELGSPVDLLLIHWPANFDPVAPTPACSKPPAGSWERCRIETWLAMEAAQRAGHARAIGVSNFGIQHLRALLNEPGRTLPVAINQVEFHPWWPQRELHRFCGRRRVRLMAYGSTGGSLTGGMMLRAPSVKDVAGARARSPAQVLLRWAVQQGVVVIPSTSSEARIAENLDVTGWALTLAEMRMVSAAAARQERMRVYLPDPDLAP